MMWSESMVQSVFSHHVSEFRMGKNHNAPTLFSQSVTLSVLCVPIGQSTLRYTASNRWRPHELISCLCFKLWLASADNSVCKRRRQSAQARAETTSLLCCDFACNRFISVQSGLKRESDNKGYKTWVSRLNKSHATANISLLAKVTNSTFKFTGIWNR